MTRSKLAVDRDRLRAAIESLRPTPDNERSMMMELHRMLDGDDTIRLTGRALRAVMVVVWRRAGEAPADLEHVPELFRRAYQRLGEAAEDLADLHGLGLGQRARRKVSEALAAVEDARAAVEHEAAA